MTLNFLTIPMIMLVDELSLCFASPFEFYSAQLERERFRVSRGENFGEIRMVREGEKGKSERRNRDRGIEKERERGGYR